MKIKEVENMLQMNGQTIRYYEKLGLVHPSRDANDYRNYSLDDIKDLKKVRFLRELDIPLESIESIIKDPDKFQEILAYHLETLQIQVENLEEIQRRCLELTKKNIPLLDTIIDGEFEDMIIESNSKMKSLLKNRLDFMQPYPVITLGKKSTPYQFILKVFGILIVSLFLCYMFNYGFKILSFDLGISNFIVFIIAIIFWMLFVIFTTHEKYYEFRDVDFYIFNSSTMKLKKRLKVIRAILNNSTSKLAQRFLYQDIQKVAIQINKKYAPTKSFEIIYYFYMNDSSVYEINSSFFHKDDQDRKTIYDILLYHDVTIIDKQDLRTALNQKELPLSQYLDKYY